MKRPLFVGLLAVLAAVTGGVLIGSFYLRERLKAWNATAIRVRYVEGKVYVSDVGTFDTLGGEQPRLTLQGDSLRYSTNLVYELTNSTSRDYTLPVPSDSMTPMKLQAGTLVSARELSWYEVPTATFLGPKPIPIPSHKTVRVLFTLEDVYLRGIVNKRTPHEVVGDRLADVDSFVLLDSSQHYRIELPLREFKNAK